MHTSDLCQGQVLDSASIVPDHTLLGTTLGTPLYQVETGNASERSSRSLHRGHPTAFDQIKPFCVAYRRALGILNGASINIHPCQVSHSSGCFNAAASYDPGD